ncbi:hypothetical protein D9M68_839240 [compost metagenome]
MSVLSPVLGSVTPKQAFCSPLMMGGNQRARCASLPCTTTGCNPKTFMWMEDAPAMPAPEAATVSIISAASCMPRPAPPYSADMATPSQPAPAMAR